MIYYIGIALGGALVGALLMYLGIILALPRGMRR
jgi:hypothetical protein